MAGVTVIAPPRCAAGTCGRTDTGAAKPARKQRLGTHGDDDCSAPRHGAVIGLAAPILRTALVHPEAVVAFRHEQHRRAGDIRCGVVAGVGGTVEGVDGQVRLQVAIAVLDRDCQKRTLPQDSKAHRRARSCNQRHAKPDSVPTTKAVPLYQIFFGNANQRTRT